jgi:hypothetical protein
MVRTTLTLPSRTVSMSIPRTTGLLGGPKRQGWTAVSGLTYPRPSSSNTKSAGASSRNLLGALVQRFPARDLAFWIDEPHVFGVRPLDGRAALLGVPLGKTSCMFM